MTAVPKKQVRAAEYRRLAGAAGVLAQTSQLANVREKHEEACARWTALAILDERLGADRAAADAREGLALPVGSGPAVVPAAGFPGALPA